jgi:preprotein translocase subunit SecG
VSILITTLHVLTCIALIAVVLLQHGRGADIGAAFGAGASQTVFGGRGAGDFLTRLTTGAAIVFMLTSLTLSYFVQEPTVSQILEEAAEEAPAPAAPASGLPEATPIEPGVEAPAGAAPDGEYVEVPPPAAQPEAAEQAN